MALLPMNAMRSEVELLLNNTLAMIRDIYKKKRSRSILMIIIAQKARAESPPPSLWMVSIAACDCSVTPALPVSLCNQVRRRRRVGMRVCVC